eukprot:Skav220128  [mRNA]  locus=scaffold731:241351:265887:- [translate_table: standard]
MRFTGVREVRLQKSDNCRRQRNAAGQKPPPGRPPSGADRRASAHSPSPSGHELRQQYETPLHPCGFVFRFVFLSTWSDVHYVGLDGIEIYDTTGRGLRHFTLLLLVCDSCDNSRCDMTVAVPGAYDRRSWPWGVDASRSTRLASLVVDLGNSCTQRQTRIGFGVRAISGQGGTQGRTFPGLEDFDDRKKRELVGYCQGMNFVAGFILMVAGRVPDAPKDAFLLLVQMMVKYRANLLFCEGLPLLKLHTFQYRALLQKLFPDAIFADISTHGAAGAVVLIALAIVKLRKNRPGSISDGSGVRPSRLFTEWEAACPSEVADFQRAEAEICTSRDDWYQSETSHDSEANSAGEGIQPAPLFTWQRNCQLKSGTPHGSIAPVCSEQAAEVFACRFAAVNF